MDPIMAMLHDDELILQINTPVAHTRDFVFVTRTDDGSVEIIHPMWLLNIDLASVVLRRFADTKPALAVVVSLCRLLVPCLEYRGNRRHLVVEKWSEDDVQGTTLPIDTRTEFSRELATEQERDYQLVTSGEQPPEDSLAEVFWDAHTELDDLPDAFEDPEMSSFVKALYFNLVPSGAGDHCVDLASIRSTVHALWKANFEALEMDVPVRRRRQVFKRVLAATIRLASQLNGIVARTLVFQRLGAHLVPNNQKTLTATEEAILELRYGGSKALRDINIGLLIGCGPLFAGLVNDFAKARLEGSSSEELESSSECLHNYIYLLGEFRKRRKLARSDERRAQRMSREDKLPAPRTAARNEPDNKTKPPDSRAELSDELQALASIVSQLKHRDAVRVQALIDAGGDRGVAAEALGLDQKSFSRQLRQTVFRNIRTKLRKRSQ